jgi:hypothetical protein
MNRLIIVSDEIAFKRCFKTNISLLDHVASDVGATDCSPGFVASDQSKANDLRTVSAEELALHFLAKPAVRRGNEFVYSAL